MVIEKTMPTTVMIAAATVASSTRATSEVPLITQDGRWITPS